MSGLSGLNLGRGWPACLLGGDEMQEGGRERDRVNSVEGTR